MSKDDELDKLGSKITASEPIPLEYNMEDIKRYDPGLAEFILKNYRHIDDTETENALKLDLYSIEPNELDEIVSRCEGKHIQQVVYSTYHKGFTRVCFGCMQVDTTIRQALNIGDSNE